PRAVQGAPNVSVVASAPHRGVRREAARGVTHGGLGTRPKALAGDVPGPVLPRGPGQGDDGVRAPPRCAGVALWPTYRTGPTVCGRPRPTRSHARSDPGPTTPPTRDAPPHSAPPPGTTPSTARSSRSSRRARADPGDAAPGPDDAGHRVRRPRSPRARPSARRS